MNDDDKGRDEIARRILANIAALPLHKQAEAIHALTDRALKRMSIETVHEMRAEITARFPKEDIPIVRSTLDLIDGQLALRQIAGDAAWR